MKSYKDLEIYSLSYDLATGIHKLSLGLPKYELFEEGGQIRRSVFFSMNIKNWVVRLTNLSNM